MESSWSSYQQQHPQQQQQHDQHSPANRQAPRYAPPSTSTSSAGVLPQHHNPPRDYQSLHQQQPSQHLYSSGSSARVDNSAYGGGGGDIQMQDAGDIYGTSSSSRGGGGGSGGMSGMGVGGGGAPGQKQQRPYLSTNSAADEGHPPTRYSPMSSTMSPQTSQYASPNPGTGGFSSYRPQQAQSPSRPNYTSASQSYYSQHSHSQPSGQQQQGQGQVPQGATSSRGGQPGLQPFQPHMLQSSGAKDSNGGNSRYYAPQGQQQMYESQQTKRASPPRDPQPRLQRLSNLSDLRPKVNSQPVHRRANPEGGFISPVQALTTFLPATYRICNPNFKYESSRNPRRVLTKPSKGVKNDGYDNEDSDYILYVNDILGSEETKNRYLILDVLGQGTFGQVVKCQNMKTGEVVAVKVIKNRTAYFNQSMMEVSVLDLLNTKLDKNDDHHILRLKDTFIHRQHLCLVFELLSVNLYELIKQNQFRGLSTTLVRVFAQQLLHALCLLNKARLIHCDLKPENILLKNLESPIIKVIDFGSACDERQTVYTYIQSRFYRSPEVLLGLPYSSSIDMWSLGCIVVELFLGLPLFPGSSEYNQVQRITEMLGMPPVWMIEMGKQAGEFFEKVTDEYGRKTYRLKSMEQYSKEHNTKEQPGKKYFQQSTLPEIIRQYAMPRKNMKPIEVEREMNNRVAFIDFVRGLLCINPMERWSPQQAKNHPFITQAKYTGPFVPPMNLKNNHSSTQQSNIPPSPAEQQRAAEAARQKQAQAQAQAAQAQQAVQQQSQQQSSYSAYGGHVPSQTQSQPPVYNNMYNPPQTAAAATAYTNVPQTAHPPAQSTTQYPMSSSQQQQQPYSQQGGHPLNYPQQAAAARNRQRSTTMMDGIPPTIQRAASMMDPNHPIRLQPSPAYFPPPPGGVPDDNAQGGMGRGRGRAPRRDFIRTLEERTLEEGGVYGNGGASGRWA